MPAELAVKGRSGAEPQRSKRAGVGEAVEPVEVGQRAAVAALPGGGDGAEPQLGCRHRSRQRPHPGVAAERDVAQNGNIRPGADTHRKARLPIRMVFENCVS